MSAVKTTQNRKTKVLRQLFRARAFRQYLPVKVLQLRVQARVPLQRVQRRVLRKSVQPKVQHRVQPKVQRKARLSMRTAATQARTMWRFISTFTGICRAISSPNKKRKSSAGAAVRLSHTRPESVSAATVSGTMRACSRKRAGAPTRSAISTRSARKAAAQSGLCSQTTG